MKASTNTAPETSAARENAGMNFHHTNVLDTRDVRIIGTGGHLPGRPVDNNELIRRFRLDTTPEWIDENIGVRERHFAPADIATSDIAAEAGRAALENAGIGAEELERIILCTTTPDWTSPAAACKVQALLGATCPAEDKQCACASFLYGLDHGARLVATGMKYVLVVGADIKSRFVNRDDRRLLPIFADGAGAVLLARRDESPGPRLLCELWSDGTLVENLVTPAGGSAMPASAETVEKDLHSVQMRVEGRLIFDHAVEIMTELGGSICRRAGIEPARVDLLVPHQANLGIMKSVARNLGIAREKVVETIQHTGNITSGTIPYALDSALRENRMGAGARVLMLAAGAGYAGGAALYEADR